MVAAVSDISCYVLLALLVLKYIPDELFLYCTDSCFVFIVKKGVLCSLSFSVEDTEILDAATWVTRTTKKWKLFRVITFIFLFV